MTVGTYLDFVTRIKNVPPEKRARALRDALEKTSLADKRNELIKRLSRGYKQRVGLAQALVHDPDVIILDEPTVGLDPKQIIEVRHLIKSLAGQPHHHSFDAHSAGSEHDVRSRGDHQQRKNRGRGYAAKSDHAAEGRPAHSRGSARRRRQPLHELLAQIPGASRVQLEAMRAAGQVAATVEAAAGKDIRSQVAAKVVEKGWPLYELRGVSLSLEDIFLELTTDDAAHAQPSAKPNE